MRGGTSNAVDIIVRALLQEFPGLDLARLRAAVERATARVASAALDTEGARVVSQQLARVEAAEESAERASILRQLAEDLEARGDAERGLVVRLSAFAEQQTVADLEPLLRLARITERFAELPLDAMTVLLDGTDEGNAARLRDIGLAWRERGDSYRAADAFERVLLVAPGDEVAHDGLETFYRSTGEWPVLVDLLQRRLDHVQLPVARAELYREIAQTLERELGDDAAARDAYREADRLEPDRPEVLEALARLAVRLGGLEDEAVVALERSSTVVREPKARAQVLHRAAEIARQTDWDRAQDLFERALAEDPDLAAATDGLVALLRDRGELGRAIDVLVAAAARPLASVDARSRWLGDAADFCVAQLETERAKQLYREARLADPTNHHAGLALVELCWDTGAVVELAPILDELCRTTAEPGRLRGYLLQLAQVSRDLGDDAAVASALARAVEIDPHDPVARRELADLRFEAGAWASARALIEGLLEEHEASLPDETKAELHVRVARCARELGDTAAAMRQTEIALALSPSFRPALMLRSELAHADPFTRAADQLALANLAPPDERALRFAAVGDTYYNLGDVATARELYREALLYNPTDRMLLTKSLGLVSDEGDWSYSLDLVQRLAESESDLAVRGRYRHLAAMIARDNLDDPERAIPLFDRAIDDDPTLFVAADELEATLGTTDNKDALAAFYYKRLGHVRDREGRDGERLRLWDRLAETCLALGRLDDAIVASEVGLSLVTDQPAETLARRERVAELYARTDGSPDAAAIAHHQALLALDKSRKSSYLALGAAYRRLGMVEHARACDDALVALGGAPGHAAAGIDELFDIGATAPPVPATPAPGSEAVRRPLSHEDWATLAGGATDPHLTTLFAILAPPFAAERARTKPPRGLPGKDVRDRDLPTPITRVLGQVLSAFGLVRPPVYADRDQLVAATVTLRARDGALAPVLVVGRPALEAQLTDRELAFTLARLLADLRSDRVARLLCPRAGDLAQLVELVVAPRGVDRPSPARGWLTAALHPVELDKVLAIGERLREDGVDPMRAARQWRTATERAADRVGLVVAGDLATCVRMLEGGGGTNATSDVQRVLDLVAASVTEDYLAVRARVEGWPKR